MISGSNGSVITMVLTDGSTLPGQVQNVTFSGIHSNSCMVVIDTTHIAVARVKNKDEGTSVVFLTFIENEIFNLLLMCRVKPSVGPYIYEVLHQMEKKKRF